MTSKNLLNYFDETGELSIKCLQSLSKKNTIYMIVPPNDLTISEMRKKESVSFVSFRAQHVIPCKIVPTTFYTLRLFL